VPPRICREVARIVQEALVNIRKHSGATQVLVRFGAHSGLWRLVIEDNGRGFDFLGRLSLSDLNASHTGPVTIKERVRTIGGDLSIESLPGRGANLEITFPQKAHVAYA
jgi:signal transduction histidine kinase